jgi:hypothetical protein
MRRIDDVVKITGHSLKGKNLTLNPVSKETIDSTLSMIKEIQYTVFEITCDESRYVTAETMTPINISDTPSTIHSIVIIL